MIWDTWSDDVQVQHLANELTKHGIVIIKKKDYVSFGPNDRPWLYSAAQFREFAEKVLFLIDQRVCKVKAGNLGANRPGAAEAGSEASIPPLCDFRSLDESILRKRVNDIKAGRDVDFTSLQDVKALMSFAGNIDDRVAYELLREMSDRETLSLDHLIAIIAEGNLTTTMSPELAKSLSLAANSRGNIRATLLLRELLRPRNDDAERRVNDNARRGVAAISSTEVSRAPASEQPPKLQDLLDELNQLVGLAAVKHEITSLINFVRVRSMRQQLGLSVPDVSLHLVFTGNPGTGKTTVARLVARIYAAIGVLRRGHLVEIDRAGLVAGYVGQTALKTAGVVTQSIDGVLFIDEAYSLAEKGAQDFGNEAIETLLKSMEDNRGQLVVIAAGYTDRMEGFIKSNPGLKSRFSKVIEFPDYTADEMLLIAQGMAREHGFLLADGACLELAEILQAQSESNQMDFGNARGVRNLFEAIIGKQANRVVNFASPTRADLQTISVDDVLATRRR
jgi:hypothetical protein